MKTHDIILAPKRLEKVIEQHPSVLKASVTVSEAPVEQWATVTLKQGTSITKEELLDFCSNRLSKFLLPEHIVLEKA